MFEDVKELVGQKCTGTTEKYIKVNSLLFIISQLVRDDTHKSYKIPYLAGQKHLLKWSPYSRRYLCKNAIQFYSIVY